MDESGMDYRDNYGYGYCEQGERYHDLKTGQRKGRVNMIAALNQNQLFATFTLEGSCNREVIELWLETCLIPELKPGQVIIMDNASFHKGGRIEELLQAASCELLYLPPYSPDLNKIEQSWSWLKSRIRPQIDQHQTLRDAIEAVLKAS